MESPTEYASKPMTAQADAAAWKHLERRIAALVEERQSESAFRVESGTAYTGRMDNAIHVRFTLVPKS